MTGRSRVTGDGSGIQMTWSCRRQCIVMRATWVGQTDDGINDVTIARHQTLCSHIQCHPHLLPGVHQSINQSIKQKNIYSAPCHKRIRRCTAQRPPTTNVSHAAPRLPAVISSSVNNQFNKRSK